MFCYCKVLQKRKKGGGLLLCHSFIKVILVERLSERCPANTFYRLGCESLQLPQSYQRPARCFSDQCPSCPVCLSTSVLVFIFRRWMNQYLSPRQVLCSSRRGLFPDVLGGLRRSNVFALMLNFTQTEFVNVEGAVQVAYVKVTLCSFCKTNDDVFSY